MAASCALASQGSKAGGDGEGEGPVGKVALQNKILNKSQMAEVESFVSKNLFKKIF